MRKSGILMHITSLPGDFGIGTMGKQAYQFIDFLKDAGQSYWQILPLNPTGYGDSPYQSCSSFAGNHYLIDLQILAEEGLLNPQELDEIIWCRREDKVDFGLLHQNRLTVLRKAFSRFSPDETFDIFCQKNSSWLPDFALFMALKDTFHDTPWYQWESRLKFRDPDAIWSARQTLKEETRFYCFVQYLFWKQWNNLLNYAHRSGISLIGDVPIYVPYDSADVWSNPELFQLDQNLTPVAVAGCPPDGFSEDGQLWGNPLYRWELMRDDGYIWWIQRLNAAAKLYDMVRLDHFRGFDTYWSIPYGDKTARFGKWIPGPGIHFIQTIKQCLPHLKLIAEDLGCLTQSVVDLRDQSGFPGMKVLGFAFDSREPSSYLPHAYSPNSVCYTGTHDNMTAQQWFDTAPADAVAYAAEYMHLTREEGFVWGAIRTAMSSVSDLCMIPIQDFLNLGAEARMNFPGTLSDSNWTWRLKSGIITPDLAVKIRKMTQLYGRL